MLVGVAALVFLLWEPHVEGRNATATVYEIYFRDPFLAYVYFASVPFFVGVYQAYRGLGYVRRDNGFSVAVIRSLRTIRICALAFVGFVLVAVVIIFVGESDDRAGGVAIGLLVVIASIAVAVTMAYLERVGRSRPG